MNTTGIIKSPMNIEQLDTMKALRRLNTRQSESEKAKTKESVESANHELKLQKRKHKSALGQDDFLKLLVTQLKHQDPLSPMKDKNFIAQMAQFSSLEQITKVNKSIGSLINKASETGSFNLLGKEITYHNNLTNKLNKGLVSSIEKKGDKMGLNVMGQFIDPKDVIKIEQADSQSQITKK